MADSSIFRPTPYWCESRINDLIYEIVDPCLTDLMKIVLLFGFTGSLFMPGYFVYVILVPVERERWFC